MRYIKKKKNNNFNLSVMKTLKVISTVLVTLYFLLCVAHIFAVVFLEDREDDIYFFDQWSLIVGLFAFPITIVFLYKRL